MVPLKRLYSNITQIKQFGDSLQSQRGNNEFCRALYNICNNSLFQGLQTHQAPLLRSEDATPENDTNTPLNHQQLQATPTSARRPPQMA